MKKIMSIVFKNSNLKFEHEVFTINHLSGCVLLLYTLLPIYRLLSHKLQCAS